MSTNKQLKVSELDFENIKGNIKEFFKSQNTFQDYNFEGSALNSLVDVLAYITHYNAINANIGINETFLETAQSRGSVVGHARQLAYTPRSTTGASAIVNVVVNDPNLQVLTLPKYHRFRTAVDGVSYIFVTTQSYTTVDGTFENVKITQGVVKTTEYVFDETSAERFIIPDKNVDTSTLTVNVRDSVGSSTVITYNRAKNVTTITGNSRIFFLNETFDGRYEVTFGDGVIGRALTNGNLIEITYVVSDGDETNGANFFTSIDSIGGSTNVSVLTINQASGGLPRETNEEIKHRAPLTFASQNRAVTPDDYKAIILENFNNVKSLVVWGGEDNDPPQYGKAFISIRPAVGETLSTAERDFIVDQIIRPKAVVSVTPIFVDPIYTYVSLEVFYKYNQSETSLSLAQLNNKVRQSINTYNDNALGRFDGVLRYSSLLRSVDTADKSIINSFARVYMKKRFIPIVNQNVRYELEFSSPIYRTESQKSVIYKSTVFTYAGEQCTLQDYVNDRGERRVRVIRGSGVNQITIASDVGFVDAAAGKIVLTQFNPSAFIGPFIEITVIGDSNDVAPRRNNLVAIDMNDVVITGSSDTISTGSAAGGLNYELVSRHA